MEAQKHTKLIVVYEVLMAVLAAAAVALAIVDIQEELSPALQTVNYTIWAIFVLDYLVRFFLAKNKKEFVGHNIFDLLAIIPVGSGMRAFRFARVFRILVFALYGVRFFTKASRFFDTNGFRYVICACLGLCTAGTIAFHFSEGCDWNDSMWWSFVTMTTVGYGDIIPTTVPGRVTAIIMMLVGIGFLGSFTSTVTSFCLSRTGKKSLSAREEILEAIRKKLDAFSELSSEDVETLCATLKTLHAEETKAKAEAKSKDEADRVRGS